MWIQTVENKIFEASSNITILDSALKSNLVFEYSCKTGQCGVCKTTLLKGEVVELRPQIALTDRQKQRNLILTCCCAPKSDVLIDAEDLSALHDIETKTLPARINQIIRHTDELIEVTLRLPPTAHLTFLSGQYLDVIKGGLRRSYSIASTQQDSHIRLLIKNYPYGKMSQYWFGDAKENDLLRIEGPKGTFFLRDKSKELVFLATGTGIAPIISILQTLEYEPNFEQSQPISVFWGNRSAEEFVLQSSFKKLNVHFHLINSCPDEAWKGLSGYVQDACLAQIHKLEKLAVYACGSNSMIQSAKGKLIENGLPENQFYSDAFVQGS